MNKENSFLGNFKMKMLNWADQFNIFCFLDNNNYSFEDPLFECIVNSVISLMQSTQSSKEIQIKIVRGDLPIQTNIDNIKNTAVNKLGLNYSSTKPKKITIERSELENIAQ